MQMENVYLLSKVTYLYSKLEKGVSSGSLVRISSAFTSCGRNLAKLAIRSLSIKVCSQESFASRCSAQAVIYDTHRTVYAFSDEHWYLQQIHRNNIYQGEFMSISSITCPRYVWTRRNWNKGSMPSGVWKSWDDRWRLRNCTPCPIDDGLVMRGKCALKGSKSSSRTNGSSDLQLSKRSGC